jgi:hypothetical protein
MSYLRGRTKSIRNIPNETVQRSSKSRIDQNIINYLVSVNEKGKLKKIASLKEGKGETILPNTYNGLNENIHIDYERKNKARRSLLYLLNKMSGGTFCPQIVDYFKEIRELKKQEEQLKEVKEEETEEPTIKESKTFLTRNNSNLISNLKNPILVGKSKNNYINYKFNKRSGKDITYNEEKNIVSKQYAKDFELKDLEDFIDSEEIEKINNNKFNFNKEAQAKKKFLQEFTIDEDDKYYHKKERNNKNKKYKDNDYIEENNFIEDGFKNFKKSAFPSLKPNKFNRMNTISGVGGAGNFKKNNFLQREKTNYMSNFKVYSEIQEEN